MREVKREISERKWIQKGARENREKAEYKSGERMQGEKVER